MPRCLPFLASFFDQFLIDFCSQLRPPETKKTLIFHWFSWVFLKNRFSKLASILDRILEPTWLHFASKNPPKSCQKSIPRSIKILIDFGIDFWSILAPFWSSSWAQVGPKLARFSAQDAPKTPPERSWKPKTVQDRILIDFSSIFDRFLMDFWWIFASFFERFQLDFRTILERFFFDFLFQLGSQNLLKDAQRHSTIFQFSAQARWRVRSSAVRWIYIYIYIYIALDAFSWHLR